MNLELSWPIVALIAVQIVLQVVALVQLARASAERVSLGGRKWLWALIIVFGEILGPIVWFVLGRTEPPAENAGTAGDAAARRSAVDALYGSHEE